MCWWAARDELELQMAVGTMLRRLPRLELAVPRQEISFDNTRLFRSVTSLPVTW
ncbi:hypothetical protein [Allokutzneria sp. A3M-2-11 16]|uniref:hypothetical protein n=1 Tax=Allokutzneria sp. A3M-2-11 16 TaxID=2962043 RepID=UPI0020B830A5|nr:hypothetical protein [Allokutzneria sp. A3M-2-11 16]